MTRWKGERKKNLPTACPKTGHYGAKRGELKTNQSTAAKS